MIMSKLAGKGDLRKHGSHGTGATNAQRILGTKAGLLVLLFDFLKGFLIILFGASFFNSDYIGVFGLCVMLGHMYPIYYGFRGGKGVATLLGVVLFLDWKAALIVLAIFLAIATFTRFISLACMIAALCFVPIDWYLTKNFQPFILLSVLFVIYRHKSNIKRLLSKTENKISFKRSKPVEN